MTDLPTLYPHQQEMLDRLRASMSRHGAVIACAPPGCGKTVMAKWILGSFASRERKESQSGHAVFAVHRRGLVDNASSRFDESPALSHGLIMSGRETYGGRRIQVASIDTLLSWFCEGGSYDSEQTYDLVVFDECHSSHTRLMSFLRAHNAKRKELGLHKPFVLGLSATPQAEGLSDLYREIVTGPSTTWLIENGYLSPFQYFHGTQGRLDKLVPQTGGYSDDYTTDSVADAMSGLSGSLVRDWRKYAEGKPTVGFFPRRSHAREAVELLCADGVRAEYVDGFTDDDTRQTLYRMLADGRIEYLANVGIVERGTDIPEIGCIQMCTAVGSVVRWHQMIGRGSRISAGKSVCIVLDHGGNIKRHGLFTDPIKWTLDWSYRPSKTHAARPTIHCPSCGVIYRGGKCSRCAYEPTTSERKSQGLVFDGSELREVKQSDYKPKKQKSNETIIISSLYKAGRSNLTFNQAMKIASDECRKQGTDFLVPRRFGIGEAVFETPKKDSEDRHRRVRDIYPFTVGVSGECKYQLENAET